MKYLVSCHAIVETCFPIDKYGFVCQYVTRDDRVTPVVGFELSYLTLQRGNSGDLKLVKRPVDEAKLSLGLEVQNIKFRIKEVK